MSEQATAEETKATAQADAEEVKEELADAKQELADAKKDGDDDKAAKLEERIDALTGDLSDIKATLKKLAERPFAPAPEAKPKAEEKAEEKTEEKDDKPKERVHRFGSRRWFGDRAYED